ncbi:hypothetical protein Tco_0634124 [Tanacetum coccineum]
MIVQAQEQVGEGSEIPTDSHHTPTTTQPSTSKPQKKQSRRKQRKDTEDPQLSGPTEPVTDNTKNMTSQAAEITKLKERVKKLEKKGGYGREEVIWLKRMLSTQLNQFTTAGEVKKRGLARQREEDANIVEWDNVQAMMDADYELAARLQAEEQGELTIEEKSRLFVELMNKRKKHFARLRAEKKTTN